MKTCLRCGEKKNKSEFHKDCNCKDGLKPYCKKCRQKETQKYREKNRSVILEKKKQWYKSTKGKAKERTQQALENKTKVCNECKVEKSILSFRQRANGGFYSNCKECEYKKNNEYRKNNPEIIRYNRVVTEQRRRKKAKELKRTFTISEWKNCKKYFNNSCAYCGRKMNNLTQDHFIPLSKGGDYTKNNIVPSCRNCNSKKHDKDFYEWYPNDSNYSIERLKDIEHYFESLC
ncbi:HNH endonuclease signature motif containing protein [Clostridioides difficile]|nr:HNH endonuclease signature motif containing protein [Clostridioides difficile]